MKLKWYQTLIAAGVFPFWLLFFGIIVILLCIIDLSEMLLAVARVLGEVLVEQWHCNLRILGWWEKTW
jgi:hypothetical protein